jgi:hypothetical protein
VRQAEIEREKKKNPDLDVEKQYGKSAVMKAALPDELSDQQKLRGLDAEKKK